MKKNILLIKNIHKINKFQTDLLLNSLSKNYNLKTTKKLIYC